MGVDPAPVRNPPPWIHTITGRGGAGVEGAHTLRVRQSSSVSRAGPGMMRSVAPGTWGAAKPALVASRTPVHASGGWGGRHRRGPTGGRA